VRRKGTKYKKKKKNKVKKKKEVETNTLESNAYVQRDSFGPSAPLMTLEIFNFRMSNLTI
jgi:hypothetical protein